MEHRGVDAPDQRLIAFDEAVPVEEIEIAGELVADDGLAPGLDRKAPRQRPSLKLSRECQNCVAASNTRVQPKPENTAKAWPSTLCDDAMIAAGAASPAMVRSMAWFDTRCTAPVPAMR